MLALGQEQTIETPDRVYKLGKLTLAVVRGFRDYIAQKIGDPFASIEKLLPSLPKEEAIARIKAAEAVRDQLDGFSMQCPLASRFLDTEEGASQIFMLLLKKHHPDATEEDGFQVMLALGRRAAETIQKAEGALPNGQAPALAGNPAA